MLTKILTTPVDLMVEFIKKGKSVTIEAISSELKLPIHVIEKWVIVLEEYKVIKTTYRGFDEYLELVDSEKKKKQGLDVYKIKSVFVENCKSRNLDVTQIKEIWPKFLESQIDEIKKKFFEVAQEKKLKTRVLDKAWMKYESDLKRF